MFFSGGEGPVVGVGGKCKSAPSGCPNESLVPLRIKATNMPIRNKATAAGGRWNPEKQLWFVSYCQVVGTELEKYIDVDGLDNKPESNLFC